MMTTDERRAMLGDTVSSAFTEATKLLGHVWKRSGERAAVVCASCGAVSKAADEKWKEPCPKRNG